MGNDGGYERPTSSKLCGRRATPARRATGQRSDHSDTVRTKVRYDADAKSRETRTTLLMHTGFGEVRESSSKGIHWHIAQEVTYAAVDPQKQKIPWVQARGADGKTVTYFDPTSGVTPQALDKVEKRRMDCIDCHNAAGHPFSNPANLVDHAINDGKISRACRRSRRARSRSLKKPRRLPAAKAERVEVRQLIATSAPKDLKPELTKAEKAFEEEMKRILLLTSFSAEGLSWRSFPDNIGHNDFAGCFRCHDGKHLDENGQAIRLQCTLCHALPQVVRDDGARSVVSTLNPDLTPPDSHSEPNFMHDHRTKVDPTCAMCHGPLKWGTEGGELLLQPCVSWPQVAGNEHSTPKPRRLGTNADRVQRLPASRAFYIGRDGHRWKSANPR